jgi:hypothetical protein
MQSCYLHNPNPPESEKLDEKITQRVSLFAVHIIEITSRSAFDQIPPNYRQERQVDSPAP